MSKIFDAKTRKQMISAVTNPRETRNQQGFNQSMFWGQYGVTQSGGSRYESGRGIPCSTQLLIALHAAGKFTSEDLIAVQKALGSIFKASAD